MGLALHQRAWCLRTLFGTLLVMMTLLCMVQLMDRVQNSGIARWAGQTFSHRAEWMAPIDCTPRTNIGFLKTHKCGSTTIQNILFRYGQKHDLHFALPMSGSYFGFGQSFKAEMVRSSPLNKLEPNIFAVHTKWNHEEVQKVMPEDTVYFTIVRDPSAVFQSLFVYARLEKHTGLTMEEFVRRVPPDAKSRYYHWGYNQMAWDLGMAKNQINNLTAVREMVVRAADQFGLVLVMERMEESLVLLAEYLCWKLSDVLVLHLNAIRDELKQQLSPAAQHLLQQKLAPDYLVYGHFAERFERHVEAFGRGRMAAAVARLRELKALLLDTCGFVRKGSAMISKNLRPLSKQVDGYQTDSDEPGCLSYTLTGMPYVSLVRQRQLRKVIERFGPLNITVKQRGAGKRKSEMKKANDVSKETHENLKLKNDTREKEMKRRINGKENTTSLQM